MSTKLCKKPYSPREGPAEEKVLALLSAPLSFTSIIDRSFSSESVRRYTFVGQSMMGTDGAWGVSDILYIYIYETVAASPAIYLFC